MRVKPRKVIRWGIEQVDTPIFLLVVLETLLVSCEAQTIVCV